MKHLMTLAALFVSSLAMAQIPTFPWNPDGNGDGLIGSSDLIDLLTVYGQEFQNAIVSENQESALLYMGEKSWYDCKYSCENLPGRWSLPDAGDISSILPAVADTIGSGEILSTWLDADERGELRDESYYYYYPYLRSETYNNGILSTSGIYVGASASALRCFCSIKQLPRVEYSACSDVINYPGCANQLVSDGWYPMGSVSDSGNQAFWRFAQ